MSTPNPYQPPSSSLGSNERAGHTRALALVLVAIQILSWLGSTSTSVDLVRGGVTGPLPFAATALATITLAAGGALLIMRMRIATWAFALASLLWLIAATRWHAPFVFSGIGIGTIATWVAWRMHIRDALDR